MNGPLEHALKRSSLHALLLITQRLLIRSGFGDVQILDRRQTRQKSRFGGHEILCETKIGSFPAKVIVKVINDAVRVRMMDEMAGAILRTKADLGVIVSPHHTTRSVANQQAQYLPARIEVIDGDVLGNLLEAERIGIRATKDVDYAFFGGLELQSNRLLDFLAKTGV